MRVPFTNQGDALFSPPGFDLLLTRDGRPHVAESFKVDEMVQIVSARKTGNDFLLMFPDPPLEVAGNPGVQQAGSIRKYIDVVSAHARILAPCEQMRNSIALQSAARAFSFIPSVGRRVVIPSEDAQSASQRGIAAFPATSPAFFAQA